MIEWFFILLISLVGLYKFNDTLVGELEKYAEYSKIAGVAIGFIFLAAACSVPELSVSIISSIMGIGSLGVSTSIGNMIYDLLLVLGITGIWYGITINERNYKKMKEISLLGLICLFPLLFLKTTNFIYGLTLVFCFIFFSWFLLYEEKKEKVKYYPAEEKFKNKITIALSFIAVVFFSYLVSYSSKIIVETYQISAMFLGALVTAFFTSSGELFSCLNAAKRKKYDLIIGTIFGVVLIDSTFVPGAAMLFSTTTIEKQIYILYFFFVLSLLSVLSFAKTKNQIWIQEGIILLLIFSFYVVLNIIFIK